MFPDPHLSSYIDYVRFPVLHRLSSIDLRKNVVSDFPETLTRVGSRQNCLLRTCFIKHPPKLLILVKKGCWWGRPDLNRRPLPGNSAWLFLRVSPDRSRTSSFHCGPQTRLLLSGARRHPCLDYGPFLEH